MKHKIKAEIQTKAEIQRGVVIGRRLWTWVLDDCRRSMNNDGVIDIKEAQEIVADVLDGPKRRGP